MNLITKGFYKFYSYKPASTVVTGIIIGLGVLIALVGIGKDDLGDLTTYVLTVLGISLVSFFIYGFCITVHELPFTMKREKYATLFKDIGFKSLNDEYPYLIDEDETEFLNIMAFHSLVPLEEWIKKQSYLASIMNAKITRIIEDESDNNIIYVLTAKQDLPTDLEWDDVKNMVLDDETFSLGLSHEGYVYMNLDKSPHAFFAGETGCGKSNTMKLLIYQSIVKGHRIKLIDFKRGISFAMFDDFLEIFSDHESIKKLLEDLVKTMNERYDLFRKHRIEKISEYNAIEGVTKLKTYCCIY